MNSWLISIAEVHPGTLQVNDTYNVRVRDTESNAWNLGLQVWDTWMIQNPGKLSRLILRTAPKPLDD